MDFGLLFKILWFLGGRGWLGRRFWVFGKPGGAYSAVEGEGLRRRENLVALRGVWLLQGRRSFRKNYGTEKGR